MGNTVVGYYNNNFYENWIWYNFYISTTDHLFCLWYKFIIKGNLDVWFFKMSFKDETYFNLGYWLCLEPGRCRRVGSPGRPGWCWSPWWLASLLRESSAYYSLLFLSLRHQPLRKENLSEKYYFNFLQRSYFCLGWSSHSLL